MISKDIWLRVSVIEQCQLRCPYCLPGKTKPFLPKKDWLSVADYQTAAQAFAAFSVSKVRFTGGEPLLRRDLCDIVAVFRRALPSAQLALTTNAQCLANNAKRLSEAGITRLNIHLDTLRPDRYPRLMGGGDLSGALLAIDVAKKHFERLKLNVVVQKGANDDELQDFLHFGERLGIQVRFIEQMNTGSATSHVQQTFMSGQDILERIGVKSATTQRHEIQDPSELHVWSNRPVSFGLIASDTRPFCDACNRMRLSVDGRLRGCLYEPGGSSLRDALKNNDLESAIHLIGQALMAKRSFHPVLTSQQYGFSMAEIGG